MMKKIQGICFFLVCMVQLVQSAGASQSPWSVLGHARMQKAFALLDLTLEVEPAALKILEEIQSSVWRFDFHKIEKLLQDKSRMECLCFLGQPQAGLYRIWISNANLPQEFGSLKIVLRLQPDPLAGVDGQGYSIVASLQLQTEGLSFETMVLFFSGVLEHLENQPSFSLGFASLFPETWGFWSQVFEVEGESAPAYIRWKQRLHKNFFQQKAPHLLQFLEKVGDLLQWKAEGRTQKKSLFQLEFLTEQLQFQGILKVSAKQLRELIASSSRKTYLQSEFWVADRGLKAYFGPMQILGIVEYLKNGASLNFLLRSVEKVRVDGKAFYVFPVQMVDALIPGNIEDLLVNFFQALQGSNARWLQKDGIASFEVHALALDNGILQIGFRMAQRRFRLGDKAKRELEILVKLFLDSLRQDWQNAAEKDQWMILAPGPS